MTGRCLCGQVAYEAEIDPERVAICHCSDCQVNAATAFGMVAGVVQGRFTLLSGTLTEYDKRAASGRVRTLSFCGICGTRIHARTKGEPAAFFGLRWGTVDQRADLAPKRQVWCRSALDWVFHLDDLPKVDTQPG